MLIVLFVAFIGLCMGSFLNVLADRLPNEETILGRSKCDSCDHILAWYNLIPVISFIKQKGLCTYCKASISIQYIVVEIITSVLFILTWYLSIHSGASLVTSVIYVGIVSILIVMFLADMRYKIIPDSMQVALIIFILSFHFMNALNMNESFHEMVYGFIQLIRNGVIVMIPLLIIFILTKGKGMGFGDVKYTFAMGMLLGVMPGFIALYISFLLGGVVSMYLLFIKKINRKKAIPFGPYLFISTYLLLFFTDQIMMVIEKLYGF